jgi:hypothetical protein
MERCLGSTIPRSIHDQVRRLFDFFFFLFFFFAIETHSLSSSFSFYSLHLVSLSLSLSPSLSFSLTFIHFHTLTLPLFNICLVLGVCYQNYWLWCTSSKWILPINWSNPSNGSFVGKMSSLHISSFKSSSKNSSQNFISYETHLHTHSLILSLFSHSLLILTFSHSPILILILVLKGIEEMVIRKPQLRRSNEVVSQLEETIQWEIASKWTNYCSIQLCIGVDECCVIRSQSLVIEHSSSTSTKIERGSHSYYIHIQSHHFYYCALLNFFCLIEWTSHFNKHNCNNKKITANHFTLFQRSNWENCMSRFLILFNHTHPPTHPPTHTHTYTLNTHTFTHSISHSHFLKLSQTHLLYVSWDCLFPVWIVWRWMREIDWLITFI